MNGNRILISSFIVALAILVGIVLFLFHSIDAFIERDQKVAHSYRVLSAIDHLVSSIKDGETAQRIYFISGDRAPFRIALAVIDRQMQHLKTLTRDNPKELRRIETIRLVILDNLGSLDAESTANLPPIRQVDRRRILAMVEHGKTVLGRIRQITHKMEFVERDLLRKRAEESLSEKKLVFLTLTLGNLTSVSILFIGFLFLRRELIQRKIAQESSKKHAEEFQDLYDHAPCGYLSLDREGRIVRINETALSWIDFSREECENRLLFSQLLTPEGRPFFDQSFSVFKDSGILDTSDYDMVKKDLTFLPVSISSRALFDSNGRFVFGRLTIFDMSEIRKAHSQILTLNATLKEHSAQLEQANKELESFSYSVSHDLRSPLRAIDGFSKILEEDYGPTLDDEARRLLDVVRKNTRKMGNLIDDLLTFARLGRKTLEKAPVNMTMLARNAFHEIKESMDGRVTINIDDPLPPAVGDQSLLFQVWINLLSNAIKFSGQKETPTINVSGTQHPAEIIYSVSDNGVGFDMRFYSKLFGVFQRLHSQEEFPGTGVGLAIVQRVISRHGGRVWAEGVLGEGATFSFALPSTFDGAADQKQPFQTEDALCT